MNEQQQNSRYIIADLVPERADQRPQPARRLRPRMWLPLGLFIATCLSTFVVSALPAGVIPSDPPSLDWGMFFWGGFCYAVPLMTILICHEAGHYIQARRYRVAASFPYFIPMPLPPLGTMGAVIGMSSNMRDRKVLFDIGITGPLAGLLPTIIFCVLGLYWSDVRPMPLGVHQYLGEPLLFKFMIHQIIGSLPPGYDVVLHPMAFAGWVGLLITSLNLFPIGQLDGGHVFYALLLKKSYRPASIILKLLAIGATIIAFAYSNPMWILMIVLLFLMGPKHPPTANDYVPLGRARTVLGCITLAFVLIGFTPMPFFFTDAVADQPVELRQRPLEQKQPPSQQPSRQPAEEQTDEQGRIVRFGDGGERMFCPNHNQNRQDFVRFDPLIRVVLG